MHAFELSRKRVQSQAGVLRIELKQLQRFYVLFFDVWVLLQKTLGAFVVLLRKFDVISHAARLTFLLGGAETFDLVRPMMRST